MNGKRVRYAAAFLLLAMSNVWCANIGMICPRNVFLGGEDPINIPDDKQFVIETMDIEEPGLGWLVRHLENDLGHVVNIYNSDSDDPFDVEDHNDLALIVEAISSGTVAADYRLVTIPVMTMEAFILDDMGLQSAGISGRCHASQVHIVNPNHPITRGLPETFDITINDPLTSEPAKVTFACFTRGSSPDEMILAELPSAVIGEDSRVETNLAFLLAVEKNSSLENAARWVWLGFSDETPEVEDGGNPDLRTMTALNEYGVMLLDNCIAWAMEQEASEVNHFSIF
ncbi:MAG: hypothetical protein GC154_12490 [bacterium]|nr:hypothetical protein [bacterium]